MAAVEIPRIGGDELSRCTGPLRTACSIARSCSTMTIRTCSPACGRATAWSTNISPRSILFRTLCAVYAVHGLWYTWKRGSAATENARQPAAARLSALAGYGQREDREWSKAAGCNDRAKYRTTLSSREFFLTVDRYVPDSICGQWCRLRGLNMGGKAWELWVRGRWGENKVPAE
jgi:hypothetical protein